jgi:prepilin-type N-terminal cleavage/methylation domain-containing protein
MKNYMEDRNEKGFTLIELLIAIVVVGILAAVAIVGIAGLTNTGGRSACVASADSARAASAAYYANQQPVNKWPADFAVMTTGTNPVLELAPGVTAVGDTLSNGTWKLVGTFTADGSAPPVIDTTLAGNCNN